MMELEFYLELLLTAVFSVFMVFLIGKIAVVGASDGERTEDVSLSADLTASLSTREEGSELKEAESAADCSERKDELVGEANENSAIGTDVIRMDEKFCGKMKMPEVLESLEEGEGERHEVGEEIELEWGSEGDVEEEGSLLHGEGEWEGIEKSEVEKIFAVATEYARSSSGAVALSRVSGDVQMELYGLNKIATEGPCYESQPLPLNFSARAKWQAWHRLGSMIPEVAMEHYINLLSKNIPGWMGAEFGEDVRFDKGNDSSLASISDSGSSDLRLSLQRQLSSETQKKLDEFVPCEIDRGMEGPKILGFTNMFILNLLSPTRGAFLSIYW